MTTRRAFLAETAGAVAGLAFVGCGLLSARPAAAQTARRQVTVAGRRVKTVDVHAHAAVPEAMALMNLQIAPPFLPPVLVMTTTQERLAQACAANPERFVAFATVALQHPDLAAAQLEEGVKKYNLRGAAIGGSVNGEEISDPKFHPFWAKAEQLGVLVFIHPQGTAELNATTRFQPRLASMSSVRDSMVMP